MHIFNKLVEVLCEERKQRALASIEALIQILGQGNCNLCEHRNLFSLLEPCKDEKGNVIPTVAHIDRIGSLIMWQVYNEFVIAKHLVIRSRISCEDQITSLQGILINCYELSENLLRKAILFAVSLLHIRPDESSM